MPPAARDGMQCRADELQRALMCVRTADAPIAPLLRYALLLRQSAHKRHRELTMNSRTLTRASRVSIGCLGCGAGADSEPGAVLGLPPPLRPLSPGSWQRLRRRLLSTALLALVAPQGRAAQGPLAITAVGKSGGSGVAIRLLTEIYRQAGLALQIEVLPASRASMMSLAGQMDGDLIRIQNYGQNYPQLLRVDPAYYRVSVRAYSLIDRFALVRTREDLQHYSVGAIRGMPYANELTENHPALTLTQNSIQMFRMLQARRLDLVLSSSIAAQSSINKLRIKDVLESPELARFELHHYLHLRHKDLAPRIAEVIRKMKASGELERLILQYEAAAASAETELATASHLPEKKAWRRAVLSAMFSTL